MPIDFLSIAWYLYRLYVDILSMQKLVPSVPPLGFLTFKKYIKSSFLFNLITESLTAVDYTSFSYGMQYISNTISKLRCERRQ